RHTRSKRDWSSDVCLPIYDLNRYDPPAVLADSAQRRREDTVAQREGLATERAGAAGPGEHADHHGDHHDAGVADIAGQDEQHRHAGQGHQHVDHGHRDPADDSGGGARPGPDQDADDHGDGAGDEADGYGAAGSDHGLGENVLSHHVGSQQVLGAGGLGEGVAVHGERIDAHHRTHQELTEDGEQHEKDDDREPDLHLPAGEELLEH